jgi:hypothetical protein
MSQDTINEMFKVRLTSGAPRLTKQWNTVAGSTYIFTCILTKLSIGFYLRRILPGTASTRRSILTSIMVTVTLVNLLHFAYRLSFCRVPTPQSVQLQSRHLQSPYLPRIASVNASDAPPPIGTGIVASLNDPAYYNALKPNPNITNTTIRRRSPETTLGTQISEAEDTARNTGMDIDVASDIKNPHAEGFCAVQDKPHLAMVLIAALVNVLADVVFLLLPLKEMLRGLRDRRWHKLVFLVMALAIA